MTATPEDVIRKLLHSRKCTSLAAISKKIASSPPNWFEDKNEKISNCECGAQCGGTKEILGEKRWKMVPTRRCHNTHIKATKESLGWLRKQFQNRVISRKCDFESPPHSRDLNPLYFICGGMYLRIMWTKTISKLKAAIRAKIRKSQKRDVLELLTTFPSRVPVCFERSVVYLEHFLDRRWLLCKVSKITETLKNNDTKAKVEI